MIQARIRKGYPAAGDSAGFSLDIELETSKGVTALFGPSGAGKSLTLDCIAGFVRPTEGRILLDDQILFDAQARVHLPPQERRCGYVFQNYALFPHMTLRQNLAFAAERLPKLERHRKLAEMLEKFRLTDVAGRKPHELSGGQKQRCSIARALIAAPKLLLLDEPTRGLDAPLRAEFYTILRQVRAEFNTPILIVTHSLEECFELADEMLVVRDGYVIQSGSPTGICEDPANIEVARLLGTYNLLAVEIKSLDPGKKSSLLHYQDFDIAGPYYPGHLRGDHVFIAISPQQLKALPRNGRPGPNQIPLQLLRTVPMPSAVRLEFAGEINVEMPRTEFEPLTQTKDWVIEFPQQTLRIL
jgi:molybdate transport system ATP-binding protein